ALGDTDQPAPSLVEAVTAQLERTRGEALAALFADHHRWDLRKWFAAASGPREQAVLDAMLADPAIAKTALACAVDAEAIDILLAWWDRSDQVQTAELFGQAFRGVSSKHRERLIAELWRRFKEQPERRSAILIASAPYRDELHGLRRLEPKLGPFGAR